MSTDTLYRWGSEFPEQESMSRPKSDFAEVRVRGVDEVVGHIEVVLGNGRVVRVHGEVDARRIRALVEVLESC